MAKRIRIFCAATVALLCATVAAFGMSSTYAEDAWSPSYPGRQVYLWDGDLVKAGWADRDGNVDGNVDAPDTYEADDAAKTVSLNDASAFAYFAHQASLPENNGFEGYTVTLKCDIDLGGDDNIWLPIGFDSRKHSTQEGGVAFRGVFDGKGHTLYNFSSAKFYENIGRGENGYFVKITDTLTVPLPADGDEEYVYGLFGCTGNATIKNLNVADVKINLPQKTVKNSAGESFDIVTDCVGAFVGYAAGDITIENCTAGSKNGDDSIAHTLSTGGFVGRAYAGKLNGKPYGTVKSVVIGKSNTGKDAENAVLPEGVTLGAIKFKNCVNYIDLGSDDVGDKNVGFVGDKRGGILGYAHAVKDLTIENCKNYGYAVGAYAGGAVSYIQPNVNWHATSDGKPIDYSYNISGFENYGKIEGKYPDRNAEHTWESFYVGGIFGRLNDQVGDYSIDYINDGATEKYTSAYAGKKTLSVTDCVNYGTITVKDADYRAQSIVTEGKNISHSANIGGMFGFLHNNKNTSVVFTDNFNYGDVISYSGNVALSGNGSGVYAGGLVGAMRFDVTSDAEKAFVSGANVGKITGKGALAGCVGSVAKGNFDLCEIGYLVNAYKLNVGSAAGAMQSETAAQKATLVYADGTNTVVTGIDKNASDFDASKSFEVEIPDGVTEIGRAAFAGLKNLTSVKFGNYSKLVKIGDFAFGDTGLTDIVLPSGLENIGAGAFADCDALTSVTLSDGLEKAGDGAFGNVTHAVTVNMPDNENTVYGEFVFDGGSYLVAKNRASALKLKAATSLASYAQDITYAVTIKYDYLGNVIDTEKRLHGKSYDVVLQNGAWTTGSQLELGTAKTSGMTWYGNELGGESAIQADFITAKLLSEEFVEESITVYAFDKGEGKVFFARNDLVYDGRSYGMNELNPLLYSSSDKLTARMTATIKSYKDADGNVVGSSDPGFPEKVCNAGTYGIKVVENDTASEYEFDIVINRATADLGDYTNVLSWKLVQVGDKRVSSELRNEAGITLYIYQTADGKEYPSRNVLSDSERVEFGVGDDYITRFVRYSVVRYRDDHVAIGIAGGMVGDAFTVTGYDKTDGKTEQADEIGVYTASAQIAATENYTLELNGLPADGAARGITINVAADGRSATVTKVWYIADVGNYAVSSNGGEYAVSDRVFGEGTVAEVPRLTYGDVPAIDYGSQADPVSLTLTLNGNPVGNLTFTRDVFTQYVNNVMPAGEYRLHIYARSVESVELDEENVEHRIHHAAFDETVTFVVRKLEMPVSVTEKIDRALRGVTFSYVYDGSAHYYDDERRAIVESALEGTVTADRSGTIWAASRYDELFGKFEIVFNLSRMQSDEYYIAANMPVRTSDPDKYTVFYKVIAPNYYDSTESGVRTDYYFEVVNVMEVDVPVLRDKVYDGTTVTADVADNIVYTVTANVGGVHTGEYDVELTLRQPDFYMWKGQTLENKTDKITVTFNVTAAVNRWDVEPGVAFWVEGKYDATENRVVGKPLFGTTVIIITDSKDNVVFDSSKNINDLEHLKAGTYRLSATVDASADYNALSYSIFVNVFEKPGLPWWAIFLIVVGVLMVAAAIILILWKKGVFQILTGKLVLAIRTKATIDATIAAVRASKIAEQSKQSRAQAEAKDKAEERAQARREAQEAERNKTNDERAAELEAKAQAEVERANQILAKATAMQERAAAMKAPPEPEKETVADGKETAEPETPKKSKKPKKAKQKPEAEAAADGDKTGDAPIEEAASVADDNVNPPTEE